MNNRANHKNLDLLLFFSSKIGLIWLKKKQKTFQNHSIFFFSTLYARFSRRKHFVICLYTSEVLRLKLWYFKTLRIQVSMYALLNNLYDKVIMSRLILLSQFWYFLDILLSQFWYFLDKVFWWNRIVQTQLYTFLHSDSSQL